MAILLPPTDRLLTQEERARLLGEHRVRVLGRVVLIDDRPQIAPGKFLAWGIIGTALWIAIWFVVSAAIATIRDW